jgi:hypothetical protein
MSLVGRLAMALLSLGYSVASVPCGFGLGSDLLPPAHRRLWRRLARYFDLIPAYYLPGRSEAYSTRMENG